MTSVAARWCWCPEALEVQHTTNLGVQHTTNLGVQHTTNLEVQHTTNLGVQHTTNLGVQHTTNLGVQHTTNRGPLLKSQAAIAAFLNWCTEFHSASTASELL
jgi:hypothetical protein